MWISRDNSKDYDFVNFHKEKPEQEYYGQFYADLLSVRADNFNAVFIGEKLPRKGSCREIVGLKIIKEK